MSILILTAPAGAGKNTIAKIIAEKRDRCAVIDVDTVRQMLVMPHKAPWEGEEGKRQQLLGVENACALAKSFAKDGCDVVILDVLSDETLGRYKDFLVEFSPKVVLLLPTFEEVQKRNTSRKQYITDDQIKVLYESQVGLIGYDEKIDTTDLAAEEVAGMLFK